MSAIYRVLLVRLTVASLILWVTLACVLGVVVGAMLGIR